MTEQPSVGLFVTCIVDAMRPKVGFASLKLLEQAGCNVSVPRAQTCCGQPAFNNGDDATARAIARRVIEAFEPFDYVVAPSGSCAGMIRIHYGELFREDPPWARRQSALSEKTWEIMSFLHDVMGFEPRDVRCEGTATYHDSCAGLRELGIHHQPRALLSKVAGLRMVPLRESDVCCGFGGTFCVKYPEISTAIVGEKAAAIIETGADTLLAGDLGCLMNIAGKLSRDDAKVKVRHAVEVLADMTDGPALCQPEGGE